MNNKEKTCCNHSFVGEEGGRERERERKSKEKEIEGEGDGNLITAHF